MPDRIAALQAELKEARRKLREGGGASGLPKPGDLRDRVESFDGVSIVTLAAPFESGDAMKGYAKDLRSALGANVIALALDGDEPQVFVTADETAVAKGVSAGDLVKVAVGQIDGKGGGRPEMAQGRGTKRDGVAGRARRDRSGGARGRRRALMTIASRSPDPRRWSPPSRRSSERSLLGLFFSKGQPWGTINDVASIVLMLATIPVAVALAILARPAARPRLGRRPRSGSSAWSARRLRRVLARRAASDLRAARFRGRSASARSSASGTSSSAPSRAGHASCRGGLDGLGDRLGLGFIALGYGFFRGNERHPLSIAGGVTLLVASTLFLAGSGSGSTAGIGLACDAVADDRAAPALDPGHATRTG